MDSPANILTVAIGEPYRSSAKELRVFIPTLTIISELPAGMIHPKQLKVSFADYAKNEGSVLLIDADIKVLEIDYPSPDCDVAGVAVPINGIWEESHIPKYTTGFLWFRTLEIARMVSAAWRTEYAKALQTDQNPMDRMPFARALASIEGIRLGVLPGRFNCFHRIDGANFYHDIYRQDTRYRK